MRAFDSPSLERPSFRARLNRPLLAALTLLVSSPAWACKNAMLEEGPPQGGSSETPLLMIVLPALFLVAMLAASVVVVLKMRGTEPVHRT